MALKYYEEKDYSKSLQLLEELISVFRGTEKYEKIMYYYAYSTYSQGNYLLAGYHFNNFVRTFPASDKTEECAFMYAYCFYLESPRYSLDQTDTRNAIKELQMFINRYPNSTRIKQCNQLVDELRGKLEMKNYQIAKQYYFLDDYKAAVVSFENILKDFPDSRYREEIMYLIIKSNYIYATKSVDTKKVARYKAAIDSYYKFASFFAKESKFAKDAEDYFLSAKKQFEILSK